MAKVVKEKTVDDVMEKASAPKKAKSFKEALVEQAKEEQKIVKPKANDQETLDLSDLNDVDLAKKLKELGDEKLLRGWNPKTKEALILKKAFLEKKAAQE